MRKSQRLGDMTESLLGSLYVHDGGDNYDDDNRYEDRAIR